MIDRWVEIVAVRGISARLALEFRRAVCTRLELALGAGRYEQGVIKALEEITRTLVASYPAAGDNPDELHNAPLLR